MLGRIIREYNDFRTTISGSVAPNFSDYISGNENVDYETPDTKINKPDFEKMLNPDTSSLNADQLMDSVIGGFASAFSGAGSFNISTDNSKLKGDEPDGGIIAKLIALIMNVIKLPMRFGYLFASLMEGTGALALGIDGLTQSVALGTKEIYLLIVAILNIIFKYALCIISFAISISCGCLFIHVVTLFFAVIYVFIIHVADFVNDSIGIDFTSTIDEVAEFISWPEFINTLCYSCFGTPVKLRDILVDVGVLQDIGNMISYDFNNTMPQYMKPAAPLGNLALDSLDKAIN
jgi:hypothetical protein